MPHRITLLAASLLLPAVAQAQPGYYQFPDLHDHTIVFAAEGDLWLVSDAGGVARRITTHPGSEYFPRFSPDGKWIAFTGEYDGNRDVYVIPSEGGEPRRLTWHPASDEVIDFTPDGKKVIFRSRSDNATTSGLETHVFTVPVEGGDPVELPLGWAGRVAIDARTGLWAVNRGQVEFRTWKRYRGGTAPTIWVGDPAKADFRQITQAPGAAAFPMWSGGRIYFLSDQGGVGNLWSIRPDGSDARRETNLKDWDVRWPSLGSDGRIVFTAGADLYVFQPDGAAVRKLAVDLPSERRLTRVRYPDAVRDIGRIDVSPNGDRLAVSTRGEIFSVAVKHGVTLPVTRGSAARERGASFSGDGTKLAYITDAPGEEEIRVIDAWGRGQPRAVKPAGKSGWHFPPIFSPDGKWIAYADQTQALYVVPAAGGAPRVVDRSAQAEISEYAFSPDGRWLAYTVILPTDYGSVRIYDTTTGKVVPVTTPSTSDYSPAWDPEGRYLYFLSDRFTNPVLDTTRDQENVEIRSTRPCMVLLRKDVKNPFANLGGMPGSDEDKKDKKDKKDDKGKDGDKKDEPVKPIAIDFDGLAERWIALPVPPGAYATVSATGKRVFYLQAPVQGMAEEPPPSPDAAADLTLVAFDLDKRKPKPFLEGVSAYRLAAKGEKIAVMRGKDVFVLDAGGEVSPAEMGEHKVSFDGLVVELNPQEEWKQIYLESWRMMRDFYWDAGMGGVDWKAERDRYVSLLPRLGVRDELRDLLGELIGELATSHTYIFGGDPGVRPTPVSTGLLGAELKREGQAFRVTRILRGDPADNVRSPLDEPGVNVRVGSYIVAVNHRALPAGQPFLAAFENLADKDVVLDVNVRPEAKGAREVVVRPLGNDSRLRYADWVRRNREYVAQKTGGKIGYLHLPDMGSAGMIAFDTWFYPQMDKEGLVVDVRWNGGGFVSQRIVERLGRRVLAAQRARGGGRFTYPAKALNGPFVVLTNEYAGSDGDIFPTAVQLQKLAPVIGMRSWGGVIGIRGDKALVDGAMLTEPEFAWWDPKQGWSLENRGVLPDIELQNLPQDVAKGIDAQLDRGIAEVLRLSKERPPVRLDFGPVPDRSRKAFEKELAPAK